MRILCDLRTHDFIILEEKRRSFNWNKLLFFVLFVGFFGISGWHVAHNGLKYLSLSKTVNKLESDIMKLQDREAQLQAEIGESMEIIGAKRVLLDVMERESVILEAMKALTVASPKNGYLDKVEFMPELIRGRLEEMKMNLTFYITDESSVVDVNANLLKDKVFRSLSMPRMSREDPSKIEVRLSGTLEDLSTLAGAKPSIRLDADGE